MASAFGHAAAAWALGSSFQSKIINWKFWLIGIVCSIIPDADVIGFKFNIAYGSFWGHRGFTHSFVFSALLGLFCTYVFYRKPISKLERLSLFLYFSLCAASHSILDAMTTGGKGVAFFSPFDNTRYFLPWRPIKVSPIGIENFLSEWGLKVIMSELIWIGIPCLLWLTATYFIKKKSNSNKLL